MCSKKKKHDLPNHEACSLVSDNSSLLLYSFAMPVKAGIIIAGNATDSPKSKSRKFLTVEATICGKNRRKLLIFIAPSPSTGALFGFFSFRTSYVDFLLKK